MLNLREILKECTAPYTKYFSYTCTNSHGRAVAIIKTEITIGIYILINLRSDRISVSKLGPKKFLPHDTKEFTISKEAIHSVRNKVHGFFNQQQEFQGNPAAAIFR